MHDTISSTTLTPDICVIGGGSGGLSVAAAAVAFGASVVLVEKGAMGGDCLNCGCVPSKALIAAAEQAEIIRGSDKFGISVAGPPKVDFARVHAHVQSVIESIRPNDSVERFRGLGVTVIEAEGSFIDKETLSAGNTLIRARKFVIATGSSPFVPPVDGINNIPFWTNETLFDNRQPVEHLVVMGGGPIGIEMAQAYRRLGAQVTVIEALTPLGKEDPELSQIVLQQLEREGIAILRRTTIRKVEKSGESGIGVHVEPSEPGIGDKAAGHTDRVIVASHLLVAAGRRPNIEGLGLGRAGVDIAHHAIIVDPRLRTTNKRIFAIGDVTGGLQFTHVANYHAGIVIRNILFAMPARVDNTIIPRVTYSDPELAHVGLGEEEARQRTRNLNILRWPLHENDRAQASLQTHGLIKIIADRKGRILGATIVGSAAGEMIHLWSLAIAQKLSLKDVAAYVAPYPTLSEIGKRAATSYFAPMALKPWLRTLVGWLKRF